MADSMFVVRYSQNGPYLTIKFEGKTEEKYNQLKQYLKKRLSEYPEVDWEKGTVNAEALY
jgi:phosphomannomutase